MKWLFILMIVVFASVPCQSQDSEFQTVDNLTLHIPAEQTHSTEDIATYIRRHFDTESKRVRAAYAWVTTYIKYDKDSIHRVILDEDRQERVTYALRRRKGVCENFAAIFNDICEKSGITSFIIEGFSKQNGYFEKLPHAWCAARVDNHWFFFDPTWDAGFINGRAGQRAYYFKVTPEEFIQTHVPYDPLFQLLNHPVSYHEINRGNSLTNNGQSFFNYVDSIEAYLKMDSLSRYMSTVDRIGNFGWPPSMIGIKLKQIKLEIELLYQDKDMNLYHSTIEDYNEAIAIFNDFINYRNHQFLPPRSNEEVKKMFASVKNRITNANFKLAEINQSKATLALNTGDIQKEINDLALSVKEQESFFENYLNTQTGK